MRDLIKGVCCKHQIGRRLAHSEKDHQHQQEPGFRQRDAERSAHWFSAPDRPLPDREMQAGVQCEQEGQSGHLQLRRENGNTTRNDDQTAAQDGSLRGARHL